MVKSEYMVAVIEKRFVSRCPVCGADPDVISNTMAGMVEPEKVICNDCGLEAPVDVWELLAEQFDKSIAEADRDEMMPLEPEEAVARNAGRMAREAEQMEQEAKQMALETERMACETVATDAGAESADCTAENAGTYPWTEEPCAAIPCAETDRGMETGCTDDK